jgi:hypothetical protein
LAVVPPMPGCPILGRTGITDHTQIPPILEPSEWIRTAGAIAWGRVPTTQPLTIRGAAKVITPIVRPGIGT